MRNEDWAAFREEIHHGKMFGVLVVETPPSSSLIPHSTFHTPHSTLHYLAAYSGQVCGRSDWEGFVPAVFDYLQEDGYFKTHEAEITALNKRIERLSNNDARMELKERIAQLQQEMEIAIAALKERKTALPTGQGVHAEEIEAERIRQSQFLNAEIRRTKKQFAARTEELNVRLQVLDEEIAQLKRERRSQSDALQRWLFSHFEMLNAQGEKKNLLDIFADTVFKLPPAGAGECCEPKLLQYAYQHNLKPLCMAMFWYGESPKAEIRHHLHYYPACSGKCKPILTWMLQREERGERIEEREYQLQKEERGERIEESIPILYEDEYIMVVDKPAGMLSVPGKTDEPSVLDFAKRHCPDASGPMMVHRLDQVTSGLLVIAKTEEAYHHLQQQFLRREVKKRYVALLTAPSPFWESRRGLPSPISLPLRPDPLNRPYQVVDQVHGKPAVTLVEPLGGNRVALYPQTGRTHQLRVHSAAPEGLNAPIVGDRLYGHVADRLYLHAESIKFVHPITKEEMHFCLPAPF